jgi:hypothetical protein
MQHLASKKPGGFSNLSLNRLGTQQPQAMFSHLSGSCASSCLCRGETHPSDGQYKGGTLHCHGFLIAQKGISHLMVPCSLQFREAVINFTIALLALACTHARVALRPGPGLSVVSCSPLSDLLAQTELSVVKPDWNQILHPVTTEPNCTHVLTPPRLVLIHPVIYYRTKLYSCTD